MNKNDTPIVSLTRKNELDIIKKYHVPSTVQPDTLFNFVSDLDYLIGSLKSKRISPRYCKEDLKYLKLKDFKTMAYPMTCFCDIGLQKLEIHMDCYGYYGLAFEKAWCMGKGIQPVQYLNRDGRLIKDIRTAFNASMREKEKNKTLTERKLENLLLHQLMYYKPDQGKFVFRVNNKARIKCFSDECEWRYIPDLRKTEFQQVLFDDFSLEDSQMLILNKALARIDDISLSFEYDDLKYIIVNTREDYSNLLLAIDKWDSDKNISPSERTSILSKIMIWTEIKGDL